VERTPVGRRSGAGRVAVARLVIAVAAVAVAVATGLTWWPAHPSAREAMCARPSAIAAASTAVAIGSAVAPRAGPLTFDPRPSGGDGLVGVVLHPVSAVPPGLTITGWECGSGRPLRLWYEPYGAMGVLPARLSRSSVEGQLVVTIPPRAYGADLPGYMQFSAPGHWSVEVRAGAVALGNVVFIVTGVPGARG